MTAAPDTLILAGPNFSQLSIGSALVTAPGSSQRSLGSALVPAFFGNRFYVNETTGADTNSGADPSVPLKTLSAALALCVANNNDMVFFSGTITLTASLAWNKNQVHLIGLCDGIKRGKRARIDADGTTAGFDKLVNVTGVGCLFANFGTFYGWSNSTSALICWYDAGGRNCYDNVEFLGFGDGTVSTGSSNLTGSRAFVLNTNVGETTWRNCVFGVDTISRNATNYTVEISGGAPRCTFENCDFESWLGSSGTASSHVLIGSAGIDRYLQFVGCRFWSATKSTGSTMAQVFNVSGSAGGFVALDRCTAFGATHWETSASTCVVLDMGTVTAHDGGISIAASPS